ncbi:MAG: transporter substrate-binding domain-containing protein [Ruminococcaceae bacterium]|nr:transporter substrate-binding domain-containing protein [Oscillospiraceae bacterium]
MMKKVIAFVLAALMILACTACGGKDDTAKKDRLAQIKENGKITLVTEPYFAPMEFIDPNKSGDDQFQGVDIEIAKYIADKLDVELEIVALDFTPLLVAMADGKYDMAISAIAYSPSRAEAMNLTDVYMITGGGYGFICRSEDVNKYNSIASLEGATVITQSGSVQEFLYNDQIKNAVKVKEFKLVDNMTTAYLAVSEGKADVCVCSTESAQLYADANGGLAVPEFRLTVDPNMNGTVVALGPDDTDTLKEFINECIAELKAKDQITKWNDEYKAYAASLGIE